MEDINVKKIHKKKGRKEFVSNIVIDIIKSRVSATLEEILETIKDDTRFTSKIVNRNMGIKYHTLPKLVREGKIVMDEDKKYYLT